MLNRLVAGASLALIAALSACSTTPAPTASASPDGEAVVHEYRTGSNIVAREKHVTTDEERQAARDAASTLGRTQTIDSAKSR